jgi:hypothetical protein
VNVGTGDEGLDEAEELLLIVVGWLNLKLRGDGVSEFDLFRSSIL